MITKKIKNKLVLEPKKYEDSHLALVKNTIKKEVSILNIFQPHSLAEQNTAALMDRIDSKYLLPINFFIPLMKAISEDYSILNSNNKRIFSYQTTYFDNQDRQFYLDHHNGKLNRYKVRFRRYVESNIGYMEIKFKNNQKRTIKQRIPMDCIVPDQAGVNDFVEKTLGYTTKLETVLFVNYQRITLLNKRNLERVTIDLNLSFRNANSVKQSIQDKTFIVEIKQERKPIRSTCRDFIKTNGYKEMDFSKYCIGSVLTENKEIYGNRLKTNRFKESLRNLERLNTYH